MEDFPFSHYAERYLVPLQTAECHVWPPQTAHEVTEYEIPGICRHGTGEAFMVEKDKINDSN